MRRPILALAVLSLSATGASAQSAVEAAPSPPSPKASATGPRHVPEGGETRKGPPPVGTPNKPAVVGGTPGAVIGNTPTAGPPGTGGPAGGPSLGGQ